MADLMKVTNSSREVQAFTPQPRQPLPPEPPPVERLHYYFIMLKRKWQILSVVLLILIPTAYYNSIAIPLYRSAVRIQIDRASAKVLPYRDVAETESNYIPDYEEYFNTQEEILRGPVLLDHVERRIQQTSIPTPQQSQGSDRSGWVNAIGSKLEKDDNRQTGTAENARKAVTGALGILPIRRSRLIEISYVSPMPQFAADVANIAAEEFIKLNFEEKSATTESAIIFLKKQLDNLAAQAEGKEEALINYAQKNGILNLTDKDRDVIRQRLEQLNDQRTQIEAQFQAKKARYEALKEATSANLPAELKTRGIDETEIRLFALERQLASLSARFDQNWPDVIEAKKELSQAREQLTREREDAYARAVKQASIEHEAARKQFEMISGALDTQKDLTSRLNQVSVQFKKMKREVDTNQQLYQALLQRLKETGLTSGMEFSNIHVVEPAKASNRAFKPQKARNLAIALFMGLFLGFGLAISLEALDNTVDSSESAENLTGLPALGILPIVRALKNLDPPKKRKQLTSSLALDLSKHKPVMPQLGNENRLMDACLRLRTSILLSNPDMPPKTILVTSSIPGEGKTTLAAHLGLVLAQTGARTILLDLDMRRPALSARFGVNGGSLGMSVFLSGNSDQLSDVVETQVPNLFLAPSGPTPPNPTNLIGSERMKSILEQLKGEFGFVVIDSPPILSVPDAMVLAPFVDGVVVVIQSGKTPKAMIKQAIGSLRRVHARMLGVVLNAVNFSTPEQNYYERYSHQNHYYSSASSPLSGKPDNAAAREKS